jgi:lipopolysaccharide export system protein LptA
MNKLIFLFLSLLSFALHALMGDHKAFVDVKAQTVVIDEPRGLSTYTGNAEVTKGSLVLSAEEIQISLSFDWSIIKFLVLIFEPDFCTIFTVLSNFTKFL